LPKVPFIPKKHGFHFRNNFKNPVVVYPFFISLETRGRCGGMAYGALDYYFAGLPIPTHTEKDFIATGGVPPDGSTLADYIYARLIDSFRQRTASKYISWSQAEDHDTWVWGKGVTRMTREDEFPLLRRHIDNNNPVVLGLIKARHTWDVGDNHQVVAYGYDFDSSGNITVYIYDNNLPDLEAILSMGPGNSPVTETVYGYYWDTWRGFFVHDYTRVWPPYKDIALSRGIWVSSWTPRLGERFDCQYTIKNYGEFPSHISSLHLLVRGPSGEILDHLLGSDAVNDPIAPNQEIRIFKANNSFGTTRGKYKISAAYFSKQNEWAGIPTGERDTASEVTVTIPGIEVNIEPNPITIEVGVRTPIKVRAVDSETNADVRGSVKIDDDPNTYDTNTFFDYTFRGKHHNVWVTAPQYPPAAVSFDVLLHNLNVRVDPFPVPVGQVVQVTVYTKDDRTDAQVDGKVEIYDTRRQPGDPPMPQDGYPTNRGFDYIFRTLPVVRGVSATGRAVAPDYNEAIVLFAEPPKLKEEKDTKEEKETQKDTMKEKEAMKEKEDDMANLVTGIRDIRVPVTDREIVRILSERIANIEERIASGTAFIGSEERPPVGKREKKKTTNSKKPMEEDNPK
jgi:hypothetical protein